MSSRQTWGIGIILAAVFGAWLYNTGRLSDFLKAFVSPPAPKTASIDGILGTWIDAAKEMAKKAPTAKTPPIAPGGMPGDIGFGKELGLP